MIRSQPSGPTGEEKILVTGGAGFIGSALVRMLLDSTAHTVVTLDKLTYAGSRANLAGWLDSPKHHFVHGDIADRDLLRSVFEKYDVQIVMHLAAESHVDRSIDGPDDFVTTNVVGTFCLLEAFRRAYSTCGTEKSGFYRFCHVSTDEVFGSLGESGSFSEASPYDPSSPYSSTKAAADHLARAWSRTYNLPIVVTNCSNNYGPYQHPEKLIPLTILNAMEGRRLPIYGDGKNVRDWLYVDDHVDALYKVVARGVPGETYNIGARCEQSNIDVVSTICRFVDTIRPDSGPHSDLIEFVPDRPGHDRRYAIDPSKVENELGWSASTSFEQGIENTVRWYVENRDWRSELEDARRRRGLGKISGSSV